MIKVLLYGGGLQGLSTACSLKEVGCYVTAIAELDTVLKSKFVDKKYKHSIDDRDFLLKVLTDDKQDVVIPMGDASAEYLSKNKQTIENDFGVKCAVPDYRAMSKVVDKSVFMEFCKRNFIPCPTTVSLDEIPLEEAASIVGFPALIKPNVSAGARGIVKVDSFEELKGKIECVKEQHGSCTLQEFIDNDEYYYNVMLYRNAKGDFLSHTVIKIVRMHPIKAGSSSCCISVENNEIVNICQDCLSKLNWVGIADFDVLQRKDSGEYKIIEINPRVPASLRAAAISGVNFPNIIVSDVLGLPQKNYEYHTGKILRYLGIDLMWFLKSKNRFTAKPSWFKFWGNDVFYQDIYRNDASTWITWWSVGFKKIFAR
ncbi:MAG: ATP-grasp domain-containing protein [Bacteroidales bacterium]|nr:ATP-grasp domain-containing protein [Bacteroidales bacterium]